MYGSANWRVVQIEAAPYNAKFEIKISKQIGHRKDKPTSKHQDKWSEILLNKPLFFLHFPALLPQVSRSSVRSLSRVDSTFDGFMCQIMYKWILNKREYLGPVWPADVWPADDIPFCSIFTYTWFGTKCGTKVVS